MTKEKKCIDLVNKNYQSRLKEISTQNSINSLIKLTHFLLSIIPPLFLYFHFHN